MTDRKDMANILNPCCPIQSYLWLLSSDRVASLNYAGSVKYRPNFKDTVYIVYMLK